MPLPIFQGCIFEAFPLLEAPILCRAAWKAAGFIDNPRGISPGKPEKNQRKTMENQGNNNRQTIGKPLETIGK